MCVSVCDDCDHADEMSESRQTHVTLHDIDSQALEQLVQYAYTAEIVVGEGNVQVRFLSPAPPFPPSRRGTCHLLLNTELGALTFLKGAPHESVAALGQHVCDSFPQGSPKLSLALAVLLRSLLSNNNPWTGSRSTTAK